MFAFEHFDVVPDIVVLGKGFGGGIMPLAGVIARRDLDIAGDRAIGHYTHEKNPVSCAAGLKTIEIIERDNLIEHSRTLGEYTVQRLRELQSKHDLIQEVRGVGLLIGIELANVDRIGRSQDLAEWVMYESMARGLSFKVSAGNVLTWAPPLTITKKQMDDAIGILENCLEIANERGLTF